MEYYSLNRLINLTEQLSLNNSFINGFSFGAESDISTEQELYPLVNMFVAESNVEGLVMNVAIDFIIMDVQHDDQLNERDTLSDTLSTAEDIYAALTDPQYQDYFLIKNTLNLSPFTEAFPDVVNGWKFTLVFQFLQDRNRCQIPIKGPIPPIPPTGFVTVLLQNSEYYLISTTEIDNGTTAYLTAPDATATLNSSSFISIPSASTTDIELVDSNNIPIVPESVVGSKIIVSRVDCEDAIAVLKNTGNEIISTTNIPSGDSQDILAPDARITIKDTDDNVLYDFGIQSNNTVPQIINNSVAILKDTDGTALFTTDILAEGSADIIAPDGIAQLRNTGDVNISFTNIKSGGLEKITAPDAIITLNGSAFVSEKSGSTNDIQLVNQDNTPITPTISGNKLTVTEDRSLSIRFDLIATALLSTIITCTTAMGNTGTITSLIQDGSSGTITISKNGGAFVSFSSPLALANNDTIQIKRTVTTAAGYVKLGGTYA